MNYKKDIEFCNYNKVHENIIKDVKNSMNEVGELENLVSFFEVCANDIRIKMIYSLFNAELCTCDISSLLKIDKGDTIYHLNKLSKFGIIKYRREGDIIYYSLKNNHINNILVEVFLSMDSIKDNN